MQSVAVANQPGAALAPIGSIWSEPSKAWGTHLYTSEAVTESSPTAVLVGESAGAEAASEGALAASQSPATQLLGSTSWTEGSAQQANRLPSTTPLGGSPASATFSITSATSGFLPFPSPGPVQQQIPQVVSNLAGGSAMAATGGTPMAGPAVHSAGTPDAACWGPTLASPQLQVVSVSVNGPAPCVDVSSGHAAAALLAVQACGPAPVALPAGMMLSAPAQAPGAVLQAPLHQPQHHHHHQQQQQQQQGVWCVQVGDQLFPVGGQPMPCASAAPMSAPAAAAAVSSNSSGSGGMLWGVHTSMASPQQHHQQQQVWGSNPSPSVMVISSHAHPHASSAPAAMMQLQSSPGQPRYVMAGASGQMVQGLLQQPLHGGEQLQPLGHVVTSLPQYAVHTPSPPQGTCPGISTAHPGPGSHGNPANAMQYGTHGPAASSHYGRASEGAATLAAGGGGVWEAGPSSSANRFMEPPGFGVAGGPSPQLQPGAKVPRAAQGQRKPKAPMAAVVYDAGGVPMAFAPRWAKGRPWDPQASVQASGAPVKGTGVFIPGMKLGPKGGP